MKFDNVCKVLGVVGTAATILGLGCEAISKTPELKEGIESLVKKEECSTETKEESI